MARRTHLLAAAVSILTLTCIFYHHCYSSASSTFPLQQQSSIPPLANSTLGFGAILAVSHSSSPRQQSLLWAANLTDIEMVIPEQKEWTVGDIEELKAKESRLSPGSAKAWLGHLEVLRWYVEPSESTR
jgi:hypothetical protein